MISPARCAMAFGLAWALTLQGCDKPNFAASPAPARLLQGDSDWTVWTIVSELWTSLKNIVTRLWTLTASPEQKSFWTPTFWTPTPSPTPSPTSPNPTGDVTFCAQDGSDYTYSETVSGDVRTIVTNHCPNHPWFQLNPNKPVLKPTTYEIPAKPQFEGPSTATSTDSAHIDLSEEGGVVGILFNGAMLYSPYGGFEYGPVSNYTTSATYAEGRTFDQCGCHASSATQASYHCHVPPHCLLDQLGQGQTGDDSHSPQVGWALDGFPVYGPRGPGGVEMKTCTQTGGTYGTDVCTDDCGGYYRGDIDNYYYRYYMQGTYNDGKSCDNPGCPSPGEEYYPHTPVCYRGCCPSGMTCAEFILPCTDEATGGSTDVSPGVPEINGLQVSNGLPTNDNACTSSSLVETETECAEATWKPEEDSPAPPSGGFPSGGFEDSPAPPSGGFPSGGFPSTPLPPA